MVGKTKIEWSEKVLNPVVGCTRVSEGCRNCYAERLAARFAENPKATQYEGIAEFTDAGPRWTGEIRLLPEMLDRPRHWKKPTRIFLNSMSDLFHEDVPFEFIHDVFKMMNETDWHQYQILTKRSRRLAELSKHLPWSENIWMGVSVENAENLIRVHDLRATDAHIKWISAEPLIGDLGYFDVLGIDWIVVGGESGPNCRPMKKRWVSQVLDRCMMHDIPFFFKQYHGKTRAEIKEKGRLFNGEDWSQYPV